VAIGPSGPGLGWTRERVMKRFPLLYPTLEGLARYTHLIDVSYFNDLMDVFKQVKGLRVMMLVDERRLNLLRGIMLILVHMCSFCVLRPFLWLTVCVSY
jgi:nucleolar complex protein 3